MLLRPSMVLLALVVQVPFPARTSETLRERYGQPISETFLVRPGVVATASYGKSGNVCQLVIRPKEPDGIIKSVPVSDTIHYGPLKKIEGELVSAKQRGRLMQSGFIDNSCPPRNDCLGAEEDYKNVVIYTNAGRGGANYAVINWNRKECGPSGGFFSIGRH